MLTFEEVAKLIVQQEAQTQQALQLLMKTMTAPKTVTLPDGRTFTTNTLR